MVKTNSEANVGNETLFIRTKNSGWRLGLHWCQVWEGFKYYGHQKDHKRWQGGGDSKRSQSIRAGALIANTIGPTGGAQKGNDYSQDQVSKCGSRSDIFIDQYWLNQDSSYKEKYILEGGWTPNLILESNEYQSYILKFVSNVVQKLWELELSKKASLFEITSSLARYWLNCSAWA